MKLTIEQFSSILCFGFTPLSSKEEDLCCEIRHYKDFEYDEIFDSVELFGLMYSKEFAEIMGKIVMSDVKDWFTSENKFMSFVLSRCLKLSETATFYNFILVCSFVHKIVSDIFMLLDTECFTLAKMTSKCLVAAFHRQYVDLFDKENGFEGFANYCEKLNESIFISSDEDSETESRSVNLDGFTPPKSDEIIDLIRSLKEVDAVDFLLTEFEKKLFCDRVSLSSYIDPSRDVFIQLGDSSELDKIEFLDLAKTNLNIKSEHILERLTEPCPLCKDNCYKHVVLAAKELEVAELLL